MFGDNYDDDEQLLRTAVPVVRSPRLKDLPRMRLDLNPQKMSDVGAFLKSVNKGAIFVS